MTCYVDVYSSHGVKRDIKKKGARNDVTINCTI